MYTIQYFDNRLASAQSTLVEGQESCWITIGKNAVHEDLNSARRVAQYMANHQRTRVRVIDADQNEVALYNALGEVCA